MVSIGRYLRLCSYSVLLMHAVYMLYVICSFKWNVYVNVNISYCYFICKYLTVFTYLFFQEIIDIFADWSLEKGSRFKHWLFNSDKIHKFCRAFTVIDHINKFGWFYMNIASACQIKLLKDYQLKNSLVLNEKLWLHNPGQDPMFLFYSSSFRICAWISPCVQLSNGCNLIKWG